MSVSLEEALGQVDLKAGQVYRCQVKGQWVIVRVMKSGAVPLLTRYDESEVMLDPWVEFPSPEPIMTVVGEFGLLPLPDVPEIPSEP